MSILDRFKTQPKWKSPDPSVRVAGVHELSEDEQEILAAIAREDDDPRVRRTAVSKLGTVTVLADTLRHDGDEGVRDEAAGVLLDIALGAYEADEPSSFAALDALASLSAAAAQKHLVLVAKTAKRETIARAALSRLGDSQKALGSVARRAELEGVRLAALADLADPTELMATATRSTFRDVALGALDRLATDANALKTIATRAASQPAARKARSLMRAMEEEQAAALKREAEAQQALQLKRRGQRELVREASDLVPLMDTAGAASRLAALEERWAADSADAEPEIAERFRAAVEAAQARVAELEAGKAAEARASEATEGMLGVRRVLLSRLESLPPDGPPEAQAAIVAEWQSLDPLTHNASRELDARFEQALKAADRRRRDQASMADRPRRLADLVTALEAVAADAHYPGSRELRQRARRFRRDWATSIAGAEADESVAEVLARGRAAEAAIDAREQAWRDERTAESDEVRRRAQQALQRVTDLARVEQPTLKSLDKAVTEAISAETALEAGPADPARDELLARLQAARGELQPKAQQLREADDWQRWANAGVQERLIGEMEKLVAAETEPAGALRKMRDLSTEWKTVASAPRDKAEALWNRFRAATDAVRARIEPLRAQQAVEQSAHLASKIALCEKAEALADSTDWIATADALKALQGEWKTIGPAPRRDEQAVWERFRAACNRFFTRRQDDLKQRKDSWAVNLEKKEALIGRAEALAEATDSNTAFGELKALQAEWKTVGPVRKSKSEQTWARFRAAADKVFDRYRNRDSQAVAGRVAQRETVLTELETLASRGESLAGDSGLLETVRSLRTGWQQAGAMPRDAARQLSERFDTALGTVIAAAPAAFRHTELDVEGNRRQLELLCERVEKLLGKEPAVAAASPAATLAHQLREALAANTIGGRVDEESKLKAHEFEVRAAQDAWRQVGFVPDAIAAPLAARFQRASQRFFSQRRPSAPGSGPSSGPRGPRR